MRNPLRASLVLLVLVLVTSLQARSSAADDAERVAAADVVLDLVRRHAVLVAISFQRDTDAEEHGAVPPDPRGMAERHRFWRLSFLVPGFVVRDRRTVLISDPWIPSGAIASVEIRTADGTAVPARLDAFLPGVEGALVTTDADLPVAPVSFGMEPVSTSEARYAASVAEGADGLELWVEGLGRMVRRPWSEEGAGGLGFGTPESTFDGIGGTGRDGTRTVDLVADASGRPIGFRFSAVLDPHGRWLGPAVVAAKPVSLASLEARERRLAEDGTLHRLKVTFRTTSRHDRNRNPFQFGGRGTSEKEYFGIAVRPDVLLVPGALTDEQVRKIADIRLPDAENGEEAEIQASYAGRLRGYHAFFVRVKGVEATPVRSDDLASVPTLGEAILVHQVAQRGGARRDQLDYNRVTGRSRGYADRRFLATERPVRTGSVLRDLDGRLLGLAIGLDPADRERKIGGGRPAQGRSPFPTVAALFADLGRPDQLVEDADVRVMPQEELAAKRTPWLGVEYDGLNEGVADLLGISAPTRDGRRGLILVTVYPDSPAARLGLETGDVLLSAQRVSKPGGPPVDLSGRGPPSYFPGMFGGGGAPAPWRPRANSLVNLLNDWGVGAEIDLLWLRDGEERSSRLALEQAPPDFSSAPRTFDEPSGVEVRDLTYEIRSALRVTPGQVGVVVARVEPGTPGAQARIRPNELIIELDGQPLENAEAFGRHLEKARSEGREQVRLVVRRLGKTRLVDLGVTGGGEGS